MNNTFIIAEAGVNHNGSLEMAYQLVRAAKKCGADCIKFQTFKAERIVTHNAPKAAYQLLSTDPNEPQLDMLKKLELSEENHLKILQACRNEGIIFLSTPYNFEDIDFLDKLGVEAFKVASGQIVENPFLEHMAKKGKPMIVSTGMATLGEVESAVQTIRNTMPIHSGSQNPFPALTLLQCTTDYPSQLKNTNLRAMNTLRNAFKTPVGYSDHTEGITACIVAVALGATIIEKHFTLDKTLPGPDQSCSADPNEFYNLVNAARQAETVLGSELKVPTNHEKENAKVMRRSIVAARDLPAGEILKLEDLTFKRPLSGLPAQYVDLVVGKPLKTKIKKDQFLDLEIIGQ